MLPQYLIYFTSFVASLGTLYYAWETYLGRVQPNKISWLLWGFSVFLGQIIAMSKGVSFVETLPLFASWFTCLLVFVASFFNKKAFWKLTNFDYACGALSVAALLVWLGTENAALALSIAILSDIFAGLPTLYKTWKKPESESLSSYLPNLISHTVGILVLTTITFFNSAFLFWLVLSNILKVGIILAAKAKK
jgi:hypothetical protein